MRVRHFLPALEFYRKLGAPVYSALRHTGLPSEIEFYPEAFMPREKSAKFLRFLRSREHIDDVGWQIYGGFGFRVADKVSEVELCQQLSIGQKVVKFKDSLWRANNFIHPQITTVPGGIKFEFLDCQGQDSFEKLVLDWTRNLAVVALVQSVLGPDWRPSKLGFVSTARPCDHALTYFDRTKILQGQATTWVYVPNEVLAYKAAPNFTGRLPERSNCTDAPLPCGFGPPDYGSLSEMLKSMLMPYVSEGFPSVDAAAEMVNCSRRSLQRKLGDKGTSYAKLTKELRIEHAQRMLAETDMKVIDIAVATGFLHAANFTRAFVSSTGLTPRAYRRGIGHF